MGEGVRRLERLQSGKEGWRGTDRGLSEEGRGLRPGPEGEAIVNSIENLSEGVDALRNAARDIPVETLAVRLGALYRYGGEGTRGGITVAEHVVLLARYALERSDRALATRLLHHDDAEALLGMDLRPETQCYLPRSVIKTLKARERVVARVMAERFGFEPTNHRRRALAKALDRRIVVDEMTALGLEGALPDLDPLGVQIELWDPRRAAREYIEVASSLAEETRV